MKKSCVNKLSVGFDDVARVFFDGVFVDPDLCASHLDLIFDDDEAFLHGLKKKGSVFIQKACANYRSYQFGAYDSADEKTRKILGYVTADIHQDGHFSVEDIKVFDQRRGIATAFYDLFDEYLAPLNARVVPTFNTLMPDGRAFWEERDPRLLELRDLYQYLLYKRENGASDPTCEILPHEPAFSTFSKDLVAA